MVEVKPKKAKEPTSFAMTNPARLIPQQCRFVSLQDARTQRYVPVCRQNNPAGIVMLLDTDPSAPETVEKGKPTVYNGNFIRGCLKLTFSLPCP